MKRPDLNDVFPAGEDECAGPCMACGDEIERGDRVLWVPAGFGPKNLITIVHLHCAVRNNEVDLVS